MRCGFVRDRKDNLRPFREIREIQRGRNKCRYKITLPNGRPQKVVVKRSQVHRFPEASGR